MHIAAGAKVAVAFALLLGTSAVAMPALAGAQTSPPPTTDRSASPFGTASLLAGQEAESGGDATAPGGDREAAGNVSLPDLEANSTVEEISAARDIVRALPLDDSAERAAANDTVAAINDSLEAFRDEHIADDEATFDRLAEAQHGLERLAALTDTEHREDVERASERLHAAARAAAELGILDADQAYASYGDEVDSRGQQVAVEQALANAVDALRRGQSAADDPEEPRQSAGSGLEANVSARQTATVQYRIAWNHSDRATDVLEANAEPTLTLETATAVERNGTVLVGVRASFDDVRAYEYETATVWTPDGDQIDRIRLRTHPTTAENATGLTWIDVGPELENRTIDVRTRATHDANRTANATIEVAVDAEDVLRQPPDPDEVTETTVTEPETGVTIEARGEGVWERSLAVANETPTDGAEYRVAPVVHVQNRTPVHNATVTLPLSTDAGAADNLSIVKWSPGGNESWKRLETAVDAENDTVTAEVDSFSYVTAVDAEEWRDYRTETITLQDRHVERWATASEPTQVANRSATPGEERWSYEPRNSLVGSSPTIVDGIAYGTTAFGAAFAVNASSGEERWWYDDVGIGTTSSVAVTSGTAFVLGDKLQAIDAKTGRHQWTFDDAYGSGATSPTVAGSTVYVGARENGTLYALDATSGEVEWSFDAGASGVTITPVVANGTVYARSTADDTLYAVDAETGELRWTAEQFTMTAPKVEPTVSNGSVFVGDVPPGGPNPVTSLDAGTGEVEWESPDVTYVASPPTVANGTLYVGGQQETLFAIDAETGETKWTSNATGASVREGPTVADGTVYVTDVDSDLHALDAETGAEQWRYTGADSIVYAQPTVARGVVYLGDWGAPALRAIKANTTASSEDSRVQLGTFGQIGDRADRGIPPGAAPVEGTDSAVVLRDSSDDGIPDAVAEANPPLPQTAWLGQFGLPTHRPDVDPLLADTSGDGLLDSEVIDFQYRVFREDGETRLEARVRKALAIPGEADTDGDGLTDYEEREVWRTEMWNSDTSGDGLNDLVDPAPRELTTLPEVRYGPWSPDDEITGDGVRDLVEVRALPTGAADSVSVRAEAKFEGEDWQQLSTRSELRDDGGIDLVFGIPSRGILATDWPERLRIVVEDDDGNAVVFQEYPGGEAPAESVETRVGARHAAAVPLLALGTEAAIKAELAAVVNGGGSFVGAVSGVSASTAAVVAVPVAIAGGLGYMYAFSEPLETSTGVTESTERLAPVPSTGYEELGLPEGLQITFPSGTTLEAPEIRLPTGATVEHDITDHERSHGWDQIKRLPGIDDPQDVGEIVEGGEGLPGRGDYDLVIGDNPNGDGQILLELLEGMIVSASVVEEFPGAEYGDHEEKRNGHTTVVHEQQLEHIRNDHDVTIEQIKEAVESPDELFVAKTPQGQDWYMWVATINGELIVVRAATVGNEVRVGTSFEPEDGYEYVKEWVQRHGADRIYS